MQGHIKAALALAAAAAGVATAQNCNGFAELCDRKYSEVTFAAAHNAAFVGTGPAHNQFDYPEAQFDRGIRYFTTQTHDKDGTIEQCHTDCLLLDVGAFSEIVVSIKNKLDANPREVATLLITNGADNIDVAKFGDIFVDTGADQYVFTPDGTLGIDDWPTLGQLIDAGTRLVVFMGKWCKTEDSSRVAQVLMIKPDYNSDTSRVPYILGMYTTRVEEHLEIYDYGSS